MEKALLLIVGLAFLVAAVGTLTVVDFTPAPLSGNQLTGNVIQEDCSSCAGNPVCAADNGFVSNHESACAARCAGAQVVYDAICERIPRN